MRTTVRPREKSIGMRVRKCRALMIICFHGTQYAMLGFMMLKFHWICTCGLVTLDSERSGVAGLAHGHS